MNNGIHRFRGRLAGVFLFVVGIALFTLATGLLPNPSGRGTHVQLGLPSCGFLARTGYPCWGCGMTTSMAAMAHGQIALAWQAHPFGVFIFLFVGVVTMVALAQACTGKTLLYVFRPRGWWLWVGLAGWLIGWATKVALGIAAGEYPLGR